MTRAEWFGKHNREVAIGATIHSLIFWTTLMVALIKKSKRTGVLSGIIFGIGSIGYIIYIDGIQKDPQGYASALLNEVFKD